MFSGWKNYYCVRSYCSIGQRGNGAMGLGAQGGARGVKYHFRCRAGRSSLRVLRNPLVFLAPLNFLNALSTFFRETTIFYNNFRNKPSFGIPRFFSVFSKNRR